MFILIKGPIYYHPVLISSSSDITNHLGPKLSRLNWNINTQVKKAVVYMNDPNVDRFTHFDNSALISSGDGTISSFSSNDSEVLVILVTLKDKTKL